MIAPTPLKRLSNSADELACRWSNGKMDLLTSLGKRILPNGCWGHAPGHDSSEPTVYLTFDDGPNPATTPGLLQLLAKHDMHATFFLIGRNCKRFPELVRRIHEAGHTIGNHTYNHLLLPVLPSASLRAEIASTSDLIEQITGQRPPVFRPPFGLMDQRASRYLKDEGMTTVYWGSAPEDWLAPGKERIVRRVMWTIKDGTLIVLHEGSHLAQQTIGAASEIISGARSQGYRFSKVNVRA